MNNSEKIVPKYEPGNKFFKKLDNFWYHNKWTVIIIAFFIVVLLVCSLQMCSNDEQDISIMYAGPYKFGQTDKLNFKSAFAEITPDRNGDGESKVALVDLYILSDEEIKAGKSEIEKNGDVAMVNYDVFSANHEAFTQHMWTGDTVICLLTPELYKSVYVEDENGVERSGFMRLDEVLGYTPEDAYDAHSIRVKDTPFGAYFPIIGRLDEDTLLCVREISPLSSMWSKKKAEDYHAYCLDVFREVFAFEAK